MISSDIRYVHRDMSPISLLELLQLIQKYLSAIAGQLSVLRVFMILVECWARKILLRSLTQSLVPIVVLSGYSIAIIVIHKCGWSFEDLL